MTKFEIVGVGFQHDAETKREARKSFRYSCRVCCERGMRIDCEKCAIAFAHDAVLAALDEDAARH